MKIKEKIITMVRFSTKELESGYCCHEYFSLFVCNIFVIRFGIIAFSLFHRLLAFNYFEATNYE